MKNIISGAAALLMLICVPAVSAETNVGVKSIGLSTYDGLNDINLSLDSTEQGDAGGWQRLSFLNGNGVLVNGRLGLPRQGVPESVRKSEDKPTLKQSKLALLLHPMGTDQSFWWNPEHSMRASEINGLLRELGYTVISLDARLHGERSADDIGPRELIQIARSSEPQVYLDTINGTVSDYRAVLHWAKTRYKVSETLVVGYSMGAQMSVLLTAQEPQVNDLVLMVPPYVDRDDSPVAPRVHLPQLKFANVLWLAATKDQYSSAEQTQASFDQIPSSKKNILWFDSGHRLPTDYVSAVKAHINALQH